MLLVDSRSSRFLIRLTDIARWLTELASEGFWPASDERALDATEAGLGFVVPRELIAVDALRFARFTCWTDADLVDRRSSVVESGLYPP